MTDKATLHRLIEALPESQLVATKNVLTYLQDEDARQTLKALGRWPCYDTDFDAWLQQQAAALRARDWTALDIDHLAEEIEEVRRSERKAVRSHWRLLWLHLLKWAYQPQGRERYGASWQASIDYTRASILASVEDSPSLQPELSRLAEEAYPWARQRAAKETHLPLAMFPEACPWSLEQGLDEDFLPEA